jgi:hypothetical protein
MNDIISPLQDDELLILVCKDSNIRGRIHAYLDTYHSKIGHVGLLLDKLDYDTDYYKECCDKLVLMTYSRGSTDNNKDEYYSGWCNNCQEIVSWECNYDEGYDVIKIYRNNVICIGKTITVSKPFYYKKDVISHDDMKEILSKQPTFIIKTIHDWNLYGSQGRKGKNKLNKRKEILINHINKECNFNI